AIERGLARVEAGAQGGHKLARGYEPVRTWSMHWIADPGFRAAVADFLERERAGIAQDQLDLVERTPFRNGCAPAGDLRRAASLGCKPFAGAALGLGDLARGHLVGNVGAAPRGFL